MGKYEQMDSLVKKGNGYLMTSQVLQAGISKPTFAKYVNDRNMRRVARGIYLAEDAWEDKLYQLQLSNTRIIYSHETALYLHDLMEREPRRIQVTVPSGYNATHLRAKDISVVQTNDKFYKLGICTVETNFYNTVRAYDIDRTICDLIKNKDSIDIQIFQYALREYIGSHNKNLNKLMKYAHILGIEEAVRTYTEVLL